MATGQELSTSGITTITEGGYVHIILPDVSSPTGFKSWQIAVDNLKNALETVKRRDAAKNADFNFSIAANSMLESIDIYHISGTITVSVGTTPSGTDIIRSRTVSSSSDSANVLHFPLTGATTLYFTISGGTVDIITNYKTNYNA